MITTSCLLFIFLGSFCLYNASEKAILPNRFAIEKFLQGNSILSKVMGLCFIAVGLLLAYNVFGITSGILFWLFSLTTIMCLLIVLSPIKSIRYYPIIILLLISLVIELTF